MTDVEDFFTRYQSAWWANSAARIESLWDTGEPQPFYKAEEIPHIMTDWDSLRAYWRHNEGFNEINELSFADFVTQPMGEARLLVGLKMRWDIKFAADAKQIDGSTFAWAGQTMGGDNHVAACLKQVDDDWRLTSWVEAPDAPILYIADLYLKNVRPDFPAA
jgi:hypothetical protein